MKIDLQRHMPSLFVAVVVSMYRHKHHSYGEDGFADILDPTEQYFCTILSTVYTRSSLPGFPQKSMLLETGRTVSGSPVSWEMRIKLIKTSAISRTLGPTRASTSRRSWDRTEIQEGRRNRPRWKILGMV